MSGVKVYNVDDIRKHKTVDSCWLAINGKVYDVTTFLSEHPGGPDVMIGATGKDATLSFEEVGHSKSAKRQMEKYLIGDYETIRKTESTVAQAREPKFQKGTASVLFNVVGPLSLLAAALALHAYFQVTAAA